MPCRDVSMVWPMAMTAPSAFPPAPPARLIVHASGTYLMLVDQKDHDALHLIAKSSLVQVQRSQSLDEEEYALSQCGTDFIVFTYK